MHRKAMIFLTACGFMLGTYLLCALSAHGRDAISQENAPAPRIDFAHERAKKLFNYYCATCHGVEGKGDGFNAFNLDPRPRDFQDHEYMQTFSDADIAKAIREGGVALAKSNLMPPWGRVLDDEQINELVRYIRRLARVS